MSRVDDLIAELAPDGVEFRPLGEVCTVFNGYAFRSSLFNSDGIGLPIVRIRDVNTGFSDTFYSGEFDNKWLVEDGDILIGMDGDFRANRWKHGRALLNQRVCRLQDFTNAVIPGFVYYQIQDELNRIHSSITGSTVKHLSSRELERSRVPVPPLEVQREIVRLLDSFTQLEAELQIELESELEARRRQYAYYRRLMLRRVDADTATLSSLGKWQGGITPSRGNSSYWTDGDVPWLASMDISNESTDEIRGRVTELALKETSLRVVPSPSVAVVMRSNILRRRLPIGLVKVDTAVNQDIRALVPRDGVSAEYVYQALRADSEEIRNQCVRTDGSMAAVSSRDFFAWEIPLPPIDEQHRIAAELGVFDALVDDLGAGLLSELGARRRQFQYYRGKLLTFEEATS